MRKRRAIYDKERTMNFSLSVFLWRAKTSHAYRWDVIDPVTLPDEGARGFEYHQNEFVFRHRSYGTDPCGGEEIVWWGGKPIWCLHSWGRLFSTDVAKPDQVHRFLRAALRNLPESSPIRGPHTFTHEGWSYHSQVSGELECFNGSELINCGLTVYSGVFHGGNLRER